MARADRVLFLVLAGAAWVYSVLRAALVPPVHDECASLLWYVRPGEWLPYVAHWDANNHYLSSGIGILLTRAFGESLFVLRAGSLLAYGLYAWAVWRVGAQVRGMVVRCCLFAALLLCPFLLDFFALFRGYGLEMACWLLALDGLMRYTASSATRDLWQTLLALLVANAAIVALVPVWALVLFGCAVLMWHGRRRMTRRSLYTQLCVLLLLGVLPLYGASVLAFDLKDRGLLYHGSTEGLFDVTVRSLSHCMLNVSSMWAASAVLVVVTVVCAVVFGSAARARAFRTPAVVVTALLCADAGLRVVLAKILGVNYPEDRAALHFVPLVLIVTALAVDQMSARRQQASWAALLLLALPARALWTANLDHTLAWREQSIPRRFVARVEDLGKNSPRPLLIGAQHQLALAWPMGAWLQGRRIQPLQTEGFPEGPHDLRIVDARFLQQASVGYHVIDSAAGPGLWLLERDSPWEVNAVDTQRAPARSTRDEFAELAHVPDSLLRAGAALVEVDVPLVIPSPSPDLRLVLEVNDGEGGKLFYDAIAPLALRPDWPGHRLSWAWGLPKLPRADRAVIYLYNPDKAVLSHEEARTVVSVIRQ